MTEFHKTPFESANARDHNPEVLTSQFVWTDFFERLITTKNHIVLGARGSGKTALVKMLSHEYLSKYDHPRARQIIASKKFIGIYVPMRLDWVGGLKNKPWLSEGDAEKYFQWRLNIVCCAALIGTLKSCIHSFISSSDERLLADNSLSKSLCKAWLGHSNASSLTSLAEALADEEYAKLQSVQRSRITGSITEADKLIGANFEMELFSPLKRGIALAKRVLPFPSDGIWCLCLDEAEYLDALHHRILNSHMRTYADGLFFKITTKPYKHYTLDTNTNEPLNEKDDFEYVYIDQPSIAIRADAEFNYLRDFADQIFAKRLAKSKFKNIGVKLDFLLSESYLLSKEYSAPQREKIQSIILKWGNPETRRRAMELYNQKRYDDQIGRKLKGAALLTEKVRNWKGNEQLDLYSGYQMVIKCADGNPRRLLGLFNAMLSESAGESGFVPLSREAQHRIMRQFSHNELMRVKSEPLSGDQIYSLLSIIGQYMKHRLHDEPISTDQIFSVRFDCSPPHIWSAVKEAVGLGLLVPNINQSNPDRLPMDGGEFRISYILAPHFMLLPRRGKAISLESILKFGRSLGMTRSYEGQLGLFNE